MSNDIASKYSLVGFIIAIIIISMMASFFAIFTGTIADEYDLDGDGTIFEGYNFTQEIVDQTETMKNSTENIGSGNKLQDVLDMVGLFFSGGWDAITTSVQSFSLFGDLMSQAAEDGTSISFNFFKPYIMAMIIVILFVGILMAVLVKWRI